MHCIFCDLDSELYLLFSPCCSFYKSLSPKDSVGWKPGKGKSEMRFCCCFVFPVVFCLFSKTALTQMFVWVCMHACALTTDVHTPWYKAWFCCCCFWLWSCDKWLEFSEALGLHAVCVIHLRLWDSMPFHHSTWWDSVHCPTIGPSWVKLKADRLGAKDPWCGEAISLSSRLWNQYQRDAGPGVGKSWTTLFSRDCIPEGLSGCVLGLQGPDRHSHLVGHRT